MQLKVTIGRTTERGQASGLLSEGLGCGICSASWQLARAIFVSEFRRKEEFCEAA